MKYTQKPISKFPKNVLLQSHEILHFVAISYEYQIFKCFSNVTILPLLCFWHRHVVRVRVRIRIRVRVRKLYLKSDNVNKQR